MHSLFLSKVSVNKPLQALQQGPYRESCPFSRPFFYTTPKFRIKIPLPKEIFPFPQRPQERSIPPCSPKVGPLWKQTSISISLLSISFRVTSNGALFPGSPHGAPTERDAPFLEPSFIHLTLPVYEPPSRFPSGTSMERDACLQSLPLHIFQCLQ